MSDFIQRVLRQVAEGHTLDAETAEHVMDQLMQGQLSPVHTAALVSAMAARGETVNEIVGFARAMRSHGNSLQVPFDVVDTCGTGGDGVGTFNISTASAVVAAAAGARVAKHGNRAVSSRSGSADVLLALGARVDLNETQALRCLEVSGLCFLFAPSYHPALRHAAQTRRELGFRTIFNILGPLTNPAGAKRQVIGVFRSDLVDKVAQALVELGTEHALVVHGAGGLDELSLAGESLVAEVRYGQWHRYTLTPEDVGLTRAPLETVIGGDAAVNAELIRGILAGQAGPPRDVVLYNTGAVLYIAGMASSIREGVRMAAQRVDEGAATATLLRFIGATVASEAKEVAQ
ncbi:anthranilate phosphoribosyltransferase [Alicyclobacillus shizuokensis]|uniref:anthranilate phosphoribosyltransferase n=1 Tax=Alicyclobacillus shizuokensis TaxID=392014 RepID=UPI0008372B20|nr:anthranilate phosphoribosyltransferase [Alicyclobacillus shizuokensis]MCL6625719.1 anthranilate phosphoribosyltransferase [Alicyclobacillus shizuokensis]